MNTNCSNDKILLPDFSQCCERETWHEPKMFAIHRRTRIVFTLNEKNKARFYGVINESVDLENKPEDWKNRIERAVIFPSKEINKARKEI